MPGELGEAGVAQPVQLPDAAAELLHPALAQAPCARRVERGRSRNPCSRARRTGTPRRPLGSGEGSEAGRACPRSRGATARRARSSRLKQNVALDTTWTLGYIRPIKTQFDQLTLYLEPRPRWGGYRPGAGRKRAPGKRPCVAHCRRPRHDERHPVLVTLRACREVESLRRRALYDEVAEAIGHVRRPDFRVVHYTVQTDHVHLIVGFSSTSSASCPSTAPATRSSPPP